MSVVSWITTVASGSPLSFPPPHSLFLSSLPPHLQMINDVEEHGYICIVCEEEVDVFETITCPDGHHICIEDFKKHITIAMNEGNLPSNKCVSHKCAKMYDNQLRNYITCVGNDPDVLVQLLSLVGSTSSATVKATPPEVDSDLRTKIRSFITDQMTLYCPHCGTAFYDFEGCFVIQCASSSCRKLFCGWCLETSTNSKESHEHVKNCPFNVRPGHYHGTLEDFHRNNLRRTRAVINYMMSAFKEFVVHKDAWQSLVTPSLAVVGSECVFANPMPASKVSYEVYLKKARDRWTQMTCLNSNLQMKIKNLEEKLCEAHQACGTVKEKAIALHRKDLKEHADAVARSKAEMEDLKTKHELECIAMTEKHADMSQKHALEMQTLSDKLSVSQCTSENLKAKLETYKKINKENHELRTRLSAVESTNKAKFVNELHSKLDQCRSRNAVLESELRTVNLLYEGLRKKRKHCDEDSSSSSDSDDEVLHVIKRKR